MKKTKCGKCSCAVQWGLIGGTTLATIHVIWSLAIAATQQGAQNFINWIYDLHRITMPVTIKQFDLMSAVLLTAVTFAFGFALGWLISKIATHVQKNCA